MVLQKRLDYGINGYQVPPIPHVPKSAKGKRSVRKKIVDKQMCAFDLLAAVAGKLLFEGEIFSSPSKISRAPNPNKGKDVIKKEKLNDEKPVGHDVCDLGSCNKSKLLREGQRHKEVFTEKESPCIDKVDNNNTKNGTIVDGNKMVVDAKPHGLVPFCGDRNIHSSISPKCWDEKLVVDRDDDEKFSGCTHPSIRAHKALKHQGIGQRRIRKQVATKFWKVASTMTKDREPSYTGGEVKPSFHNRKLCYTRQRTQRSAFKRRKLFQRCSILASNGRINGEENMLPSSSINGHLTSYDPEDFHVKLRIKSFKVPELFIELPETSTVGSLKRTVMEAVTAILGGGLHVGVLLRGKKVKDDDKTLIQAGISHSDMLDDVGFTLEPKSNHSPALLTSPEESQLLLPCVPAEPVARRPVMPTSDGKSDVCPEPPLTPQLNCLESDLDSVHSPADTLSLDKTAENVRPLIAIPSLSVDALPMIPTRKPKRSDMVQRRIRRPFSVSEVEALVQAVEKLGTGRWRDVKIRAFDNAKHRTYVDLKDKWKTLVHTARISPQQRRGEPVPQDLLDRVLSAHAYWSHQQAKSPTTETCLLI